MARIRDEQAQSLGYEDVLPGSGIGNVPRSVQVGEEGIAPPPIKPPVEPPVTGTGGVPDMGPLYQLGGSQGGAALPFPGMEVQLDPSAQILASLEQYRMNLIQAIFAHLTGGGLG